MPKVTIGKTAKLDEMARKIYRHVKADYTLDKLLPIMGYSAKTHSLRMRNPGDFTLSQLRTVYRLSDATDEEFLQMIREDKDARRS